jgi:flagellar biosynthetic protein FliO
MAPSSTEAVFPGIGWESIGLSFASLGLVCLVAWAALRLLAGRSAGAARAASVVRVIERCPLEPRRTIYVVVVAGRHLLLGVGEGSITVLAELDGGQLPTAREEAGRVRFADVLVRALRRRKPSALSTTTPEPP